MRETVTNIRTAGPTALIRGDVETMRDTLLACARNTTQPQRDQYIGNLYRRARDGRLLLHSHELAIQFNAFQRGAPQVDVEAPAHANLAIVRRWYHASERTEDIPTLVRAETVAQGIADVAECDLRQMSPKALAEAEKALAVHQAMISRLLIRVRQELYAPTVAA